MAIISRKYHNDYYKKNRIRIRAKARKRNKEYAIKLRQEVTNYLLSHPCIDCGESDPIVLEFDHVKGIKFKAISTMLSNKYSWEKIKAEIAKCEVRCANCHRRVTHRRR